MESSNARNEKKIRNLTVHLTRLTAKDIRTIRSQVKREAELKRKKNSNANTERRKSSRRQSHETSKSVNCISEAVVDDVSLNNRSQIPTKPKRKRRAIFSSKSSRKKKRPAKKETLGASTSTWDANRSYSTSEESELEEVVPRKIWVAPSARSMSPTRTKLDVAAESETREVPRGIDIASEFPIRKPVIRLKKIAADTDMKYEIKDEAESEESADENLQLELQAALQSWEDGDDASLLLASIPAPGGAVNPTESTSPISANSKIIGQSPRQCSCQLVTPSRKITTAVQTNEPEVSSKRTRLINEPAKACTQNTVSVRDASAVERNENDEVIFSPVIFDNGTQDTQESSCHVSSPIIFGSNESTAAESAKGSNNLHHGAISDPSNISSSFSLELSANELSEKEAASKNCGFRSDASQDFSLQLSQKSNGNSQASLSSCSFTLGIPGECSIEDSSASKNLKRVSRHSKIDASSDLFRLEASNIPESDDDDQLLNDLNFSASQTVHSPTLKNKSHSGRIESSAAKSPNFLETQKILCSVKPLNPKSCKIAFRKKARNPSGGEKSKSSAIKDPRSSKSKASCQSTTEAPHPPESRKINSSGSRKSCLTQSQAAEIRYPSGQPKSYLPPMEGTKSPISVPVKCNDAFTQTDPQGAHQPPSQVSVNYIINSPRLDTIHFEGPVINHPSTMTAISEKVPASNRTLVADGLRYAQVFSPNRMEGAPCEFNVQNLFHRSKVSDFLESDHQLEKSTAPAHSTSTLTDHGETPDCRNTEQTDSDAEKSQLLASEIVIDSIDLTGDDEPECKELLLGKVRLKTPSELGCTVAFVDDVERLFRHELPKLQCTRDKLEHLKSKHFNLFKVVLAMYSERKPVIDVLQELFSSRSVPCGSNLLRYPLTDGLSSVKMSVKSFARPNSAGQHSFNSNTGDISHRSRDSMLVRGHQSDATVLE